MKSNKLGKVPYFTLFLHLLKAQVQNFFEIVMKLIQGSALGMSPYNARYNTYVMPSFRILINIGREGSHCLLFHHILHRIVGRAFTRSLGRSLGKELLQPLQEALVVAARLLKMVASELLQESVGQH